MTIKILCGFCGYYTRGFQTLAQDPKVGRRGFLYEKTKNCKFKNPGTKNICKGQ